jgi:acetyltransferase-like isoleucine patch superfamily enzyme
MKPKLSVMIPTYNSAGYLKDAIDSVLLQNIQDMEILILDNASTDETEGLVKSYTDKRIKYFRNKRNIGAARNINECLKHANGIYLRHLCADDVLLPGILEKQIQVLDSNSGIGLVTCDMIITDDKLENGKRVNFYPGFEKGMTVVKSCSYAFANYIGGPSNVMFKRSACPDGVYDHKLSWVSDLTFFSNILKNHDYFNIDEPGYYYRRHGNADSLTAEKKGRQRIEEIEYSYGVSGFHLGMVKYLLKDIGAFRKIKLLANVLRHGNNKNILKLMAAIWSFRDYSTVLLSDFFGANVSLNVSYSNTQGIISIGKGSSIGSFTVVRIENGPGTDLETSSLLVGENTYIGELNNIRAAGGLIRIGDNVLISQMVTIVASNHSFDQNDIPIAHQKWKRSKIVIEDDVWIGAGVTILPGAHLSRGSIVAANSVVNSFVPAYAIVAGSPSKQIGNRPAPGI